MAIFQFLGENLPPDILFTMLRNASGSDGWRYVFLLVWTPINKHVLHFFALFWFEVPMGVCVTPKKCKMHQTAPSPGQKVRQGHAGTVMQATVLEHALWVTHAVRMTHAQSGSHISPLSAHPARTSPPFWPRAKPKFWLLGGRELWCGPYQNALLHSLLGAMLDWKFISDNLFDTCLCDRWTQLNSNGW